MTVTGRCNWMIVPLLTIDNENEAAVKITIKVDQSHALHKLKSVYFKEYYIQIDGKVAGDQVNWHLFSENTK